MKRVRKIEVFEDYKDSYLLTAMDKACYSMANSKKKLGDMTESEFNRWLSTHDFTRGAT